MRSRVATELGRVAVPALVVGVALAGAGFATSTSAQAAGSCTSTSGVTVVVQFPSGTATGCAPGNPGTALSALRAAGFSTVGSVRFHDGVVCAINNFPSSTPCVMPPTNGYWAIFWANRGGGWTYSQLGVASLTLKPGQVLALRYGSGEKPTATVPGADSPKVPSRPTTKPTTAKPAAKPTTAKPTAKPPVSKSAPKPKATTHTPSSTARATSAPATPRATSGTGSAMPRPSGATSSAKVASPASRGAAADSSGSTAAATSSPGTADPSRSGSAPVRSIVKSTQEILVDGNKEKVVTFDDGTKITVPADSKDAARYRPGTVVERSASSSASMTIDAPASSVASHPSISVSGSVPGLTVPEAKKADDSNNLPGILAGVGVLGVAAVGAGVALRRRG